MNASRFIKNILFPPKCIFCGRVMEPNTSMYVCGRCGNDIEFCSECICCEKCGKPIVSFGKRQLCYFCINEKSKQFDRIVSVFTYEGIVKDAVKKFKNSGLKSYVKTFADCVAAKVSEEYGNVDFDFMCGVLPSRKNKFKKKTFDQVDLICKIISSELGIRYEKKLFKYTRKTKKQSELGFSDRRANISGSVKVAAERNILGKTVLLVDDICTTRSTLIEYSRALKAAGAKKVYAVTIATVRNPK